ncbi:MAG: DVUA0089 family protein [Verrucomicrobiota bacterium]|nr:DVUA0089 family protein [Verrucomicrobiota bacterium]
MTGSLHAQIYAEIGDAGQTLGTAQSTGIPGTTLSAITGTISSATDADLFFIRITSFTTFSATTVNATTMIDTALFLFDITGAPIYTNDDASGISLQSRLPGGSSFTLSLAPGVYILGISLSGNEPINLNSQLLFAGYPSGDSTAVRGPSTGNNPMTLSNFSGQTSFPETGVYRIDLTSTQAAVPEPSTIALVACGAVALTVAIRRRTSAAA